MPLSLQIQHQTQKGFWCDWNQRRAGFRVADLSRQQLSAVLQWKGEMESRFGLSFAVMVRQYISEMRLPRKPNTSSDQIDLSYLAIQGHITA